MTIEEIKEKLAKKAIIFQTGGSRPTKELLESWIGCVCWKRLEEEIPIDQNGKPMFPIATLFLKDLPYIPDALQGMELITVFMAEDIYDHLRFVEDYFCIRVYENLDKLVVCDWKSEIMKAFPLVPQLVENDYPTWDGGGIPMNIEDEILRLEDEEDIDYYGDICEEIYREHKIGGYPAFCQPGYWFEDYDFVFQISSDEKAQFNIVDNGEFYFFYHKEKKDWKVTCDFY
ncbi:MAG: DUF1963 domain-containing protein [Clostridiales bacterium]|nr:DUF1963 domain-containing protein [Clostridiales bacterium]